MICVSDGPPLLLTSAAKGSESWSVSSVRPRVFYVGKLNPTLGTHVLFNLGLILKPRLRCEVE